MKVSDLPSWARKAGGSDGDLDGRTNEYFFESKSKRTGFYVNFVKSFLYLDFSSHIKIIYWVKL